MIDRCRYLRLLLVFLSSLSCFCALFGSSALGLEHLTVDFAGKQRQFVGEAVYEDPAGGLLLKTDEGGLWPIEATTILQRKTDSVELVSLNKKQLGERLVQELGPDFKVHESKHYVVVYNTTPKYAVWCSVLLERLQKGFLAFWKKSGAKVHAPKNPLPVLVFNNKASYLNYAKKELGSSAGNAIGYYRLETNRIAMYDLTGSQAVLKARARRGSKQDITALLQTPQAQPLVSTIIHEATHQIAYNCGLQKRLADNPIWVSEGLAVYFETPNLSSSRLWSGTNKVNYSRWDLFRNNVQSGKAANLKTLIVDDNRLRHPSTAVDGYAEAWAWNYFLIKWHRKEYTKYLAAIAEKPRFVFDDRETRLADFQEYFGEDLGDLEAEFYRRMSKLK